MARLNLTMSLLLGMVAAMPLLAVPAAAQGGPSPTAPPAGEAATKAPPVATPRDMPGRAPGLGGPGGPGMMIPGGAPPGTAGTEPLALGANPAQPSTIQPTGTTPVVIVAVVISVIAIIAALALKKK